MWNRAGYREKGRVKKLVWYSGSINRTAARLTRVYEKGWWAQAFGMRGQIVANLCVMACVSGGWCTLVRLLIFPTILILICCNNNLKQSWNNDTGGQFWISLKKFQDFYKIRNKYNERSNWCDISKKRYRCNDPIRRNFVWSDEWNDFVKFSIKIYVTFSIFVSRYEEKNLSMFNIDLVIQRSVLESWFNNPWSIAAFSPHIIHQ